MNRREFMKGLLALPLIALAPKDKEVFWLEPDDGAVTVSGHVDMDVYAFTNKWQEFVTEATIDALKGALR